jgi:hypothetical protein
VPVIVADARADERQPGPQTLEERLARGAGAAVVRHLQDVPAPPIVGEHGQQVVVTVLLQVARQEGALLTQSEREHDRGVVDGASGGRRPGGQAGERRPEHVYARLADREGIALRQAHA